MLEITTLICRVPTRMPKSTCGRSFSFALPAVHCRTGYVGRDGGCCTSQGVTRRMSGTNGVLLNNARSPNSPWHRWLVVQWINPSSSPTGPESCCEMVIVI